MAACLVENGRLQRWVEGGGSQQQTNPRDHRQSNVREGGGGQHQEDVAGVASIERSGQMTRITRRARRRARRRAQRHIQRRAQRCAEPHPMTTMLRLALRPATPHNGKRAQHATAWDISAGQRARTCSR